MFKHGLFAVAFALSHTLAGVPAVFADKTPEPAGPVVLTVSGAIANESADGVVRLDMDGLAALGAIVVETSTIWTEDTAHFVGVSLRDILDYAGVEGDTIEAVALNDYKVDIPVNEISDDYPIVAYELDGQAMSPRGKGPLWIIYPYDSKAEYQSEVVYSRSIWQLDRIVAK